jgi:hypothetical protein
MYGHSAIGLDFRQFRAHLELFMQRLSNVVASLWICAVAFVACSEDDPAAPGNTNARTTDEAQEPVVDAGGGRPPMANASITYRTAVTPVTRLEDAQASTFIPPFEDCRDPAPGDSATRADAKVCTNVGISGCTEEGKYFPKYADCGIVRRQRPYWPAPPARQSVGDDPRLNNRTFMAEAAWASAQIAASGCACCHDGRLIAPSQWDIALGPLWIDSLSDTGLSLFAGLADSSVLGAYPASDNHGFDRSLVGVPTTDPARMKSFALAELKRRGRSEEWARAVPPFGGPIYDNSIRKPEACTPGNGVEPDGSVRWTGGSARYVYILRVGSKNPGVPPNLDLPEGTLWRLDVLASEKALTSGIAFGQTPAGTFQAYPESTPAAPLARGERYQLFVLLDVGVPLINCTFEFGKGVAAVPAQGTGASPPVSTRDASGYANNPADSGLADAGSFDGSTGSAAMCTLPMGDARGFGAPCNDTATHRDCPCAANYCSKSPFDTQGYCSITGCKETPSVCPAGWSCFDVSIFAAGQPSVCMQP